MVKLNNPYSKLKYLCIHYAKLKSRCMGKSVCLSKLKCPIFENVQKFTKII